MDSEHIRVTVSWRLTIQCLSNFPVVQPERNLHLVQCEYLLAWGSLPLQIKKLSPNMDRRTEGSLEAMPNSSCLLDGNQILQFSQWTQLSSIQNEYVLSQRGLFQRRRGGYLREGFSLGVYKRDGKKKKNPNDSKDLNHPVDILGFHLGGPLPLCFSLLTHSMCMEHC